MLPLICTGSGNCNQIAVWGDIGFKIGPIKFTKTVGVAAYFDGDWEVIGSYRHHSAAARLEGVTRLADCRT